ncbi:hypothetical protein [Streptomyces muensis]|uniref:Uncharacterized protein n=1 Tax=Streptomyces muensis TaxID=1077944 RepID=A0A9X1PUR6_STRM4|nr:hypothetical protein [Streptomyces muensis]MCF1592909.1 hypothetical protein [Streptomyces muensis]
MSVSVLTEHANRSSAPTGLPLRADRARQMSELAPVLATPAITAAPSADLGITLAAGVIGTRGGNTKER